MMRAGLQLPLKAILRTQCRRCYASIGRKTDYYKVLEVNPTSTTSDIRAAYMRLSQIHHPDKGGRAEKFAQLQEAYEVLSKIPSRYAYDASNYSTYERSGPRTSHTDSSQFYYRPGGKFTFESPYDDPRHGPRHEQFYKDPRWNLDESFYGIKGIRRQPHVVVAIFCMGICAIGTFMHYLAIRTHSQKLRDLMYERSVRATSHYKETKERAVGLGRDDNLRRVFGRDNVPKNAVDDGDDEDEDEDDSEDI